MIRRSFSDDWWFRTTHTEGAPAAADAPAVRVTLPHDAVLASPRRPDPALTGTAYFPGGAWEYSKRFLVPEEWRNRHVLLEFEAVYRSASVFVNGSLAAHTAFGYSEFGVCLDPFLRFGTENEVRVQARAHRDSRWYSGGGIIRPVHLVVADPVHVALDGIVVTTPDVDADFALVQVDTTVDNVGRHTATRAVTTRIIAPDGTERAADTARVTVLPGEPAVVHQRMLVPEPRLWSTDTPSLYRAVVTVTADGTVTDEAETTFGIRVMRVDAARGLRINGEPVKLRGACVHHDNGVIGAAAIARAEERRVERLKAAGFNAIRSSHQPMSRAMLDACDRHGVLVMDELSDMWTQTKSDHDAATTFPDSWRRDLESMIRKARNRPSVFAYSIGNEIPDIGTGHGAAWARRIATEARRLDPTRFVTSGVNGALLVMSDVLEHDPDLLGEAARAEVKEINGFMMGLAEKLNTLGTSEAVSELTAEPYAALDIAGMNYLDARYEHDRSLFPNRVIVGSETFPTRIDELWSLVLAHPHVIGDFTWTGWDYLGEVGIGRPRYAEDPPGGGPLAEYPWITAWVGDIDITGRRRPPSFYREIVFGRRAEPYIAVRRPGTRGLTPKSSPWAWSDSVSSWTWPGAEGTAVEVEVYSDAPEVELFVDGTSAGRLPAGPARRYRAVFDVRYEPGHLEAVAVRSGRAAERVSLRSANCDRRLVVAPDRADIAVGDTDLSFVDIDIVDAHGTRATDGETELELRIDGPGHLQGFGSAAPRTEESYLDPRHRSFQGHALAVIRPTAPGTITVTVRGSGVGPSSATIVVR
ncbi:glycoside hydrolase family 2 TIM barrel-domain containing protein [Streptomyces sp. B6B3]|uniref:glycoside hydrolase family 2 TIM barrel-domain containing protein n=1 Tax=Streptomyces sp. B6B3 TaxID=3153570 RepID=UPI00325F94D1